MNSEATGKGPKGQRLPRWARRLLFVFGCIVAVIFALFRYAESDAGGQVNRFYLAFAIIGLVIMVGGKLISKGMQARKRNR